MKKTKIVRFVESLVFLPIMTMVTSTGGISTPNIGFPVPTVVAQANQADTALQLEANAIDAYFASYNMPLAGTGMLMAQAAEKNELDWRLLPAISVRESTGGKHDCGKDKNNPFGWGSCKISFDSIDKAINTVAKNLGGNDPRTAYHYDNKSVVEILHAYNPPTVVRRYAEQVIAIMNAIGPADITATDTKSTDQSA